MRFDLMRVCVLVHDSYFRFQRLQNSYCFYPWRTLRLHIWYSPMGTFILSTDSVYFSLHMTQHVNNTLGIALFNKLCDHNHLLFTKYSCSLCYMQ